MQDWHARCGEAVPRNKLVPTADGRGRGPPVPTQWRGSWKACPLQLSSRGLVPTFKTLSRGTASRPLLSQPVLAGFSEGCRCLLPARPHPRPGPAVPRGPASVGTWSDPRPQQSKPLSPIRHLQLSAQLQEPLCKVEQLQEHALPLPPGPSVPHPTPASHAPFRWVLLVPAGWQLAPLLGPPP